MPADEQIAEVIVAAHAARHLLTAPLAGEPMDDPRAYRIQGYVTQARLDRGEGIVGWKLGYTSQAMRQQMGISEPNFGPLTDAMILRSPAVVPATVTQPRVEPEIALVIGADGHSVLAHAALEVVDSVWMDYSFTWAENTADGSSAAYVVVGPELPQADLREVAVELSVGSATVAQGTGAAAMGDPLAALDWLRGQLVGHPRGLVAGDVVITGGLTAAFPLDIGMVARATFLGAVVEVTRAQGAMSQPGMGVLGP